MSGTRDICLWRPEADFGVPRDAYGRLVANAGLLRALARYGDLRSLHVQSLGAVEVADVRAALAAPDDGPSITTGSLLATSQAASSGTLISGQPYLTEPAWIRRHAGKDTDYSIVGHVFAFSSAVHRERMVHSLLAPVHPWDALVCSSPSLLRSVEGVLDAWEEQLRERLQVGAAELSITRPQLPLIPIGTEVGEVRSAAADPEARRRLRQELNIAEGDAMVLSLARLSYLDKAFPQAMMRAAQGAQDRTGVKVHLVLAGWFPNRDRDLPLYLEAAQVHAPDVRVTFLDGNDPEVVRTCWAAADVFLLLSDTIIETFGQALVEAMAAGLPLVVSDWDGYRWLVRHGEEGLLVPTLGSSGGAPGELLALLEMTGQVDYGQYAGATAEHMAVHIGRATDALSALLESPELRARMGESGQRRASALFDWQVVIPTYLELFDDLRERRETAERPISRHRVNPLRGDPFATFSALPSTLLNDTDTIWATGTDVGSAALDNMFPGVRGTMSEAALLLSTLRENGPMSASGLLSEFPASRRPFLRMTLLWLAKQGAVDWLSAD